MIKQLVTYEHRIGNKKLISPRILLLFVLLSQITMILSRPSLISLVRRRRRRHHHHHHRYHAILQLLKFSASYLILHFLFLIFIISRATYLLSSFFPFLFLVSARPRSPIQYSSDLSHSCWYQRRKMKPTCRRLRSAITNRPTLSSEFDATIKKAATSTSSRRLPLRERRLPATAVPSSKPSAASKKVNKRPSRPSSKKQPSGGQYNIIRRKQTKTAPKRPLNNTTKVAESTAASLVMNEQQHDIALALQKNDAASASQPLRGGPIIDPDSDDEDALDLSEFEDDTAIDPSTFTGEFSIVSILAQMNDDSTLLGSESKTNSIKQLSKNSRPYQNSKEELLDRFRITLLSRPSTAALGAMVLDPMNPNETILRFFVETASPKSRLKQKVAAQALLFFVSRLVKKKYIGVTFDSPLAYAEAQYEPGVLQTMLKTFFAAARPFGFDWSLKNDFNEVGTFIVSLFFIVYYCYPF